MNKILSAAFIFTALMMAPLISRAEECNAPREAIVQMTEPEYSANAVWDTIYGEENAQERFVGGMVLESGFVLAVGERFANEDANAQMIVAQIDKYGRVVQELAEKIPGLRAINKVTPRKTGFLVAGRKRVGKGKPGVWLGFFDFGGKLLRAKEIRDAKFSLEPWDVVPLQQGDGYLLAAAAEDRNGVHHAVIYKLDATGNVVSHKAFAPGLDNAILSLSPAGPDQYMGAGFIRGDDGRKTGWLVLYNKDAEIIWQRSYPRGRESIISSTADYIQGYMIAAGESKPAGGGNRAGWVMMINRDSGDIGWQRYYTGKLDYAARDILVSGKSLFSVLLDGMVPDKSQEQSSIRLLTFNPRGSAFENDRFTNGEGAHAYRLLPAPGGERIVLGGTDMSYRVKKAVPAADEKAGPVIPPPPPPEPVPAEDDKAVLKRSMDGWAIAAIPLPPYEDPCAAPSTEP